MAVNDIYKLIVIGKTTNGDPNINTFYYRESVLGLGNDEAHLVSGWNANILSYYRACLSNIYTVVEIDAYRVAPTIGALFRSTAGFPALGTVAANSMPDNLSIVISKRTGLAGRSSRGRVFMPGVPATFITAGLLNSTGQTAYDNMGNAMVTGFADGGFSYTPVLFNKRKPPLASFFNPLVFWIVNTIPRQQRRREVGVRIHPKKH